MIQFTKKFALIMMVIFLFSVLTVEPEYAQGYENDDFPVFVENDAVFAIFSNEFTITIQCLSHTDRILPTPDSHPAAPPFISTNPYRGPPSISLTS